MVLRKPKVNKNANKLSGKRYDKYLFFSDHSEESSQWNQKNSDSTKVCKMFFI